MMTVEMIPPDEFKRAKLARNRATNPAVLLSFAKRGYSLRAVAGNPNTPESALILLANNDDPMVHLGLVANPNTPAEALAKLVSSSDWEVVEQMSRHPNLTPEIITTIWADARINDYVLKRLAQHPNLPPHLRAILAF
jgi:hypothetical protein